MRDDLPLESRFMEFNVTDDSAFPTGGKGKVSVRASDIASFRTLGDRNGFGAKSAITLFEPDDDVVEDDEGEGSVRRRRTLFVTESYEEIQSLLVSA